MMFAPEIEAVRRRGAGMALGLVLLGGCRTADDAPAKPATTQALTPALEPVEPEPFHYDRGGFPLVDPAAVKPLAVTELGEPVGDGYPEVPIKMSKPLYSGKWLGLANGTGQFFGPRHVLVNIYRSKPTAPGVGDLANNVLLDVETGTVTAQFGQTLAVQWHFGLAVVAMPDDPRPYLLDAEAGTLTPATPAGTHPYVYGRNYWLRLSPIAKRVWVLAEADDGTVHLYAWDDLTRAPERPNNPFPFMPERWDPERSDKLLAADTEEVMGPLDGDCTRAILQPPKGYQCLDEFDMENTLPLSGGWRVDENEGVIFNRETKAGWAFSSLCEGEDEAFAQVEERMPPRVKLRCSETANRWFFWTPSAGPAQLTPDLVDSLWTTHTLVYDPSRHNYLALPIAPPDVLTKLTADYSALDLVGHRHSTSSTRVRKGPGLLVLGYDDGGHEFIDTGAKLRSRPFQAVDAAMATQTGASVAVISRGRDQHVVSISLGDHAQSPAVLRAPGQ